MILFSKKDPHTECMYCNAYTSTLACNNNTGLSVPKRSNKGKGVLRRWWNEQAKGRSTSIDLWQHQQQLHEPKEEESGVDAFALLFLGYVVFTRGSRFGNVCPYHAQCTEIRLKIVQFEEIAVWSMFRLLGPTQVKCWFLNYDIFLNEFPTYFGKCHN